MAKTAAQIIDANGGPAKFAARIGATPDAVRMMKHRWKLPRQVWPEVLRAFPNITMTALEATEPAAERRARQLDEARAAASRQDAAA